MMFTVNLNYLVLSINVLCLSCFSLILRLKRHLKENINYRLHTISFKMVAF